MVGAVPDESGEYVSDDDAPAGGHTQVVNNRRQRLSCSHYTPVLEGNHAGTVRPSPCPSGTAMGQEPLTAVCVGEQATRFPCVIYCHGNCGSRVDASDCLDLLLPQNISVFAFDFSGSGLSDGKSGTQVTPRRRDRTLRCLRRGRTCGGPQADVGARVAGETISLGFYEQDDLMAVIEYLRNWSAPRAPSQPRARRLARR